MASEEETTREEDFNLVEEMLVEKRIDDRILV